MVAISVGVLAILAQVIISQTTTNSTSNLYSIDLGYQLNQGQTVVVRIVP